MPVLYSYTAMIPSLPPSTGPIGVFDSGYGGLTILDKIRGLMPEYDYIYLGDSARCPYGPRSFEVVYEFTLQAVSKLFLAAHQIALWEYDNITGKCSFSNDYFFTLGLKDAGIIF